jgi:hypothetical protein
VAGLLAVAALPLLTGMGEEAYRSAAAFDAAFRRAMPLCAGVLVVGAVLAFTTVRRPPPGCLRPECRRHGSLTAPPLEPERSRGVLGAQESPGSSGPPGR